MKRLVIIVEGETEEAFVNQLLMPYIWHCGYTNSIQCFKLKHSGGGVSKYNHIKNDLLNSIELERLSYLVADYSDLHFSIESKQ